MEEMPEWGNANDLGQPLGTIVYYTLGAFAQQSTHFSLFVFSMSFNDSYIKNHINSILQLIV